MYWSIFGLILAFFVIRSMWRSYTHPSHVLGRQAANMNWVAIGFETDKEGYKDLKLGKKGMETIISFRNTNVELIKPWRAEPFQDFIKLERWLLNQEQVNTEEDTVKRLLQAYEDEDEYNYHSYLDKAVDETEKFFEKNNMYVPYGSTIKITSELFVYISSYHAMLSSGESIVKMGWNSFKRSIENRIISTIENPPILSDSIVTPQTTTLIHYTSDYFTKMTRMEKLLLNNKNESGDFYLQPLITIFLKPLGSDNLANQSLLQVYFREVSNFSSQEIVPKVIRAFG